MNNSAWFRFYAELNDFLPVESRGQTLSYAFRGAPGIKDPIETFGIPHSEVELIVVNGESVGFGYKLHHGDRVAVYPVFESLDVTPLVRLRERPLRRSTFILDVNLGKLARRLRLLGFDCLWRNDYSDAELVRESVATHRIILTRDRRLLYHRAVTHGYWVRSIDADEQAREIMARLDLYRQASPFRRCISCNGLVHAVPKTAVIDRLEPLTKRYYEEFFRCQDCGKVFWKGSHYEHILRRLRDIGVTSIPMGPDS